MSSLKYTKFDFGRKGTMRGKGRGWDEGRAKERSNGREGWKKNNSKI